MLKKGLIKVLIAVLFGTIGVLIALAFFTTLSSNQSNTQAQRSVDNLADTINNIADRTTIPQSVSLPDDSLLAIIPADTDQVFFSQDDRSSIYLDGSCEGACVCVCQTVALDPTSTSGGLTAELILGVSATYTCATQSYCKPIDYNPQEELFTNPGDSTYVAHELSGSDSIFITRAGNQVAICPTQECRVK